MVTYSSEFVEQIVIERDLLNHKLKQQQSDLRRLVDDGYELDKRKYYKMSREDILERIIQLIKRGE